MNTVPMLLWVIQNSEVSFNAPGPITLEVSRPENGKLDPLTALVKLLRKATPGNKLIRRVERALLESTDEGADAREIVDQLKQGGFVVFASGACGFHFALPLEGTVKRGSIEPLEKAGARFRYFGYWSITEYGAITCDSQRRLITIEIPANETEVNRYAKGDRTFADDCRIVWQPTEEEQPDA